MSRVLLAWTLMAISAACHAASPVEIACALTPTQSRSGAAAIAALGGTGAATAAVGQGMGWSVVLHSSGAAILTGSSGYMAGTLGAAAAAGPVIVAVGIVAVTGATMLELACAPRNHPKQVARIAAAGRDATAKFKRSVRKINDAAAPKVDATRIVLRKWGSNAIGHLSGWAR